MAIDLAHKQPPPDPADAERRAELAGRPPLTELASEQRDALNFSYRTTLSMDPRLRGGDGCGRHPQASLGRLTALALKSPAPD